VRRFAEPLDQNLQARMMLCRPPNMSRKKPAVVLIDEEMLGIDGVEVCRRLRADPSTREIPIILVSSHSEAEYLEEAFVSGCSDHVIKPINENELLTKVRSYLGD
jgi:CheY-like chemotaxis protein